MRIIRSISQMADLARRQKLLKKRIGFVPTMGALHEGHLNLIKKAKQENGLVVVSIFVNPVQFGPKEDFKKYPRVFMKDAGLCRKEGVDIIFYPEAASMYPQGYGTYINVDGLSDLLCGHFRPGHFKGVATIVAKLFNIVSPDTAYFGQKDAQQAVIIKRIAEDLNFPVKIKVLPTIREKNGLAMSSRNIYLNEAQKKDAPVLFRSLRLAKEIIGKGISDPKAVIRQMRRLILATKGIRLQYLSIVDPINLKKVKKVKKGDLIVLAALMGRVRLIDNIIV